MSIIRFLKYAKTNKHYLEKLLSNVLLRVLHKLLTIFFNLKKNSPTKQKQTKKAPNCEANNEQVEGEEQKTPKQWTQKVNMLMWDILLAYT